MWLQCTKCKKYKPLYGFHRQAVGEFGVLTYCKGCRSVLQKQRYYNDTDWRKKRNDCSRLWSQDKYQNDVDYRKKSIEQKRLWRKNNPSRHNSTGARYRATKLNQTPPLTENEKKKIELYYQITTYLGPEWHVDHIIPLSKGGLHHPDNLQVIPAVHNLRKHNNENYVIPENYIFRI